MEKIRQIWCAEDNCYYPEIKIENGRTYKLDEETFVYLEQLELGLTSEEQELMENPVDYWGQEWRKFMTENYPEEIPSLQERLKWELIPRQIDKECWQMWELLRKQYAAKNPRPTTFLEIAEWEKTRAFKEKIRTDSKKSVLIIYRSTSKVVRYLSAKCTKTC